MQPWQIKALELETSGLKHLDGFVHDHALYFLIGAIYLLLALLVWVLCGALRPKGGNPMSHVPPAIVIRLPGTPPQPSEPPDYYDHDDLRRIQTRRWPVQIQDRLEFVVEHINGTGSLFCCFFIFSRLGANLFSHPASEIVCCYIIHTSPMVHLCFRRTF
jgi:hypothetical protein